VNEASQQLKQVIDLSREIGNQATNASVVPFSIMNHSETQDGFGLSNGEGLVLVRGDVTDTPVNAWSLQITAALAFDVSFGREISIWANEKNRTEMLGKYYYAVTADQQMCAVVWEMSAWSRLLSDLSGPQGQNLIQWLIQIFNVSVEVSTREAWDFSQRFGGRILRPDEQDLTMLYGLSAG